MFGRVDVWKRRGFVFAFKMLSLQSFRGFVFAFKMLSLQSFRENVWTGWRLEKVGLFAKMFGRVSVWKRWRFVFACKMFSFALNLFVKMFGRVGVWMGKFCSEFFFVKMC